MKITVFFVLGFLVLSSVLVNGLTNEEHIQTQLVSLLFEDPTIIDNGSSATVRMNGAPACVYQPGQPVLPMYTTTLQLPFGSTIQDVTIQFDDIKTLVLHERIISAPTPFIQGISGKPSEVPIATEKDKTTDFYPAEWMTYSTGGGLNQESKHVTFFTLRVYPVRYNQATETLLYLDSCDIIVTYEPLANAPFPSQAKNDLVIICPTQFVLPLLRLAEHKNMVGVFR